MGGRALLLAIGLGVGLYSPALAYTGGPALLEVLGWDVEAHRVYLRELPQGETGSFGAVVYLEFDSTEAVRSGRASWSRPDASEADPEQLRRLEALRSRLRPLVPSASAALPKVSPTVTAVDSITTPNGRLAAFHLRTLYDIGLTFECTSYGREFLVKDVYRLPCKDAYLFITVFRGNPFDGLLAETQVPVVVMATGRDQTKQVVWTHE